MTEAKYEMIELCVDDAVAILTLSRPERLNALIAPIFDECVAAINEALRKGARALVITGAGRAFCSGADLRARRESASSLDLGDVLDQVYNPFARYLADLEIPIVTAINGPAAGAGAGLAMAGDISVMGQSAYLQLAFVKVGLVPDFGATWLVSRAVGRARALEMVLLGERITAEVAQATGLVNRVVEDEAVLNEAIAVARTLATGPTLAIAMIRKQVTQALGFSFDRNLDVERDHQRRAGRSADFAEAVAAFGENRLPAFSGN